MTDALLRHFVHDGVRSPKATFVRPDPTILRHAAVVRDSCIDLLSCVRTSAASVEVSKKIEQIIPSLERHVNLEGKLKQWHFAEEFDAMGNTAFQGSD